MSITLDKICVDGTDGNSIKIVDTAGDELNINADGSINAVISGQVNVYAEDSPHTSGDDGNFVLAVRQDTKASTAGTDGDYAALVQNSLGELYVVDEAGNALLTTIDADTSSMALDLGLLGDATQDEDAASAGGEKLMMIGGYRQDADTSPVSADGDFHGFIFNDVGRLKVDAQLDPTANTSLVVTNTSVDDTVGGTQLVSSALAGRRILTIQNLGDDSIWVKAGTGVTSGAAGNGFEIPACSSATYSYGPNIDVYAITEASGSATVKVIEAS